jgi:hypothetical protein
MVSRRRALSLGVAALAAVTGCSGRGGTGTESASPTDVPADTRTSDPTETPAAPATPDGPRVADGPTRTPGDLPAWTADWSLGVGDANVLGLDAAGDRLYATVSADGGPAGVAAVDPGDETVAWRRTFDGEAVGGSHAGHGPTDQWGVTVTDDAVYVVTGEAVAGAWTAVRALGRDGTVRWSLRRERSLAVAGAADGLVVVAATAFRSTTPEPTGSATDTPTPPRTTVLGVDAASGAVRWTTDHRGVADVAVGEDRIAVATARGLVGLGPDGGRRFRYSRGPGRRVVATPSRCYYLTGDRARGTLHGLAPDGRADWTVEAPSRALLAGDGRVFVGGDRVLAAGTDGAVEWWDDDHGVAFVGDPDDGLYARAGRGGGRVTAYDVAGAERWTFDPPSSDAWPVTATADALVARAITGETATEPFGTVYAVDADGRATASLGLDTLFDATGNDGTVYLADGESTLRALDPP